MLVCRSVDDLLVIRVGDGAEKTTQSTKVENSRWKKIELEKRSVFG